ncbi:MAG: transposase [Thermoguttaceae bacterium]|nr:transposase [Thermoguttaceae bacterium]
MTLVREQPIQVIASRAEKQACRAFPEPQGDGLKRGTRRNFQVLDPLEFLAEFTQHIPPKGSHLIRYYGWYSNKARGMRRKAAEAEAAEQPGAAPSGEASEVATPSRPSRTGAML